MALDLGFGCSCFLCTGPGNAQTNGKFLNPMTDVVSDANDLCRHALFFKYRKAYKTEDRGHEHPYKAPKF